MTRCSEHDVADTAAARAIRLGIGDPGRVGASPDRSVTARIAQ